MARFLMCPPDYFGIEYEINPWMRLSVQVDPVQARSQWWELHRVLTEELGASVELLQPVKGLPDLTFTANAGYVEGTTFVSSSFRYPERQQETPYFEAWFAARGYQILTMPLDCYFEGEGDALRLGSSIAAGYRHRSQICSHTELARITGHRVLSLELIDPYFYHLDTCFAPLSERTALYYPEAFDSYANKVITEFVADPLAVTDEAAHSFACNAVVIGKTVVTNVGSESMGPALNERGYSLCTVDLSEFTKSGGSVKCLVLRLDG